MSFQEIFARERLKQIVEILTIITGISGLTLSNLRQDFPILFYGGLVLLILLAAFVFFSWQNANRLEEKEQINSLWRQLVTGASESVKIFAGDVSWINRDEDVFRKIIAQETKIYVLCRRPNNEVVQANMRKLIQSGSEVRYYDPDKTPVVRGLVIDDNNPNTGTALTVSKKAKKEVDRKYGFPGDEQLYDYLGLRYLPPDDIEQVRTLAQLFQRTWDQSMRGYVLTPLNLGLQEVAIMLRVIEQYSKLEESDLSFANVSINNLWAACDVVKDYKRNAILALLDAFDSQNRYAFESVICESDFKRSVLLPPLLERHDDKLVVIDGTHRLFFRHTFLKQSDARCIIVNNSSPLPSTPVQFSAIKLVPHKPPRHQSFISYKPEYFRDISLLDTSLETEYAARVAT